MESPGSNGPLRCSQSVSLRTFCESAVTDARHPKNARSSAPEDAWWVYSSPKVSYDGTPSRRSGRPHAPTEPDFRGQGDDTGGPERYGRTNRTNRSTPGDPRSGITGECQP